MCDIIKKDRINIYIRESDRIKDNENKNLDDVDTHNGYDRYTKQISK